MKAFYSVSNLELSNNTYKLYRFIKFLRAAKKSQFGFDSLRVGKNKKSDLRIKDEIFSLLEVSLKENV